MSDIVPPSVPSAPSAPASPPSPPPPPPAAPVREPWPSWKQVAIMFGGGFLLALSGCFGMLLSFDYGDYETVTMVVTSIVFLIGLLAFLIGSVMFLMKILRALFRKPGSPS
jgi:hypothetical protein